MENILNYKEIINNKPIHIVTVSPDGKPNISVASNNIIIDENTIIISVSEMVNTQENILKNKNIGLTAFDNNWKGVRVYGTAEYKKEGKYYDLCKDTYFGHGEVSPFGATKPKGVIIIHIEEVEKYV